MKRIYANEEVCIGCRLCEIHCIVEHSSSKKIIKAFKEEKPRAINRVLVEESGPISFALQCRHCEEAPCIDACITGAMHRDPDSGAILSDRDKCVGCWMCIMVCPFGVITQDTDQKISTKCDLCGEREIPICVEKCPNEALSYEER